MTRAEITREITSLPPHSRGRRPLEAIAKRMTNAELRLEMILEQMAAELRVAMDLEFETLLSVKDKIALAGRK